MTVFIANTNVLDLTGLKDKIDGSFINDAAVSVTIKNAAGVNIVGQSWPLTMDYVAGSDGDYRAILSNELEFVVARTSCVAFIDADGGDDLVGHWELSFKPAVRSSKDESPS